METDIAVEFEAGGRKLRVVVERPGPVQAIVVGAASKAFMDKLKVPLAKEKFPDGVKVFDPSGNDVTDEVKAANFGPGVCYMIGFQLVCW